MKASEPLRGARFIDGLVFGFDLGTASIGYAVRRGAEFLDVGVLLCPEDCQDLETRRDLRRQRRTKRSRNARRDWFAQELVKLGFPNPTSKDREADPGLNDPVTLRAKALSGFLLSPQQIHAALAHLGKRRGYQDGLPWAGESQIAAEEADATAPGTKKAQKAKAKAEEADEDTNAEHKKQAEEEAKTKAAVAALRQEMADFRKSYESILGRVPQAADLLAARDKAHGLWVRSAKTGGDLAELWQQAGMFGPVPDQEPRQRKEVWPREFIEEELRAILSAQAAHFPQLGEEREFSVTQRIRLTHTAEQAKAGASREDTFRRTTSVAEWLLFGACREMKTKDGRTFYVYDRGTDPGKAAPGLLGLCYPRFDNRHPHVDLLTPTDAQGRPIHVARKNKPEAQESLFEQAILNFRVLDKSSGKKVIPSSESLDALREMYQAGRRKGKKESAKKAAKAADSIAPLMKEAPDVRNSVEIKRKVLDKWVAEHPEYALLEDQKELKASLGTGRARFCRANLKKLAEDFESIARGEKEQSAWQPVLRSDEQSAADAMDAFLSKIKHGLVQHRMRLFVKLLGRLSRQHEIPDHIVYETARTLSFGKTRREEEAKKRGKFEKERQGSIDELRKERRSTNKNAILRYRLWKESAHRCPFCLKEITQADVFNAAVDIAHIYPKSLAPCNEQWNLTVACVECNRHDMEDRIPREAYGNLDRWPKIEEHARTHFKGKKLELFLSPNREKASEMVRPGGSLAQTGYIGKMVRQAALIHFSDAGWLHEGKDPTGQANHPGVLALKPSNGQITSALRKAWGLDSVLHPRQRRLTEEEEIALTDEERRERDLKRMEIFQKNRGDHRHHAIDAMVLACTWPARALRIHEVTKEGVAQDQERKRRLGNDEGYFFWEAKRQQWLAAHPLYEDHREMRRTVERWCERLVAENRIEHHRSKSNQKGGYKLNFLAKVNYRQPDEKQPHQLNQAYYLRERVTKLTIKKILAKDKDVPYIHPPEMKDYLAALWQRYAEDVEAFLLASAESFAQWAQSVEKLNGLRNDEIITEFRGGLCYEALSRWQTGDVTAAAACHQKAQRRMVDDLDKKTFANLVRTKDGSPWRIEWRGKSRKGQESLPLRYSAFSKLPADFTERLCFSAFQKWRGSNGTVAPEVPSRVVIPIRRLMMLVSADSDAMAKVTGADGVIRFVPRKEYRQVEIVDGEDGGVVLVFVPFYKGDAPYAPYGQPKPGGRRHKVLRKGDLVRFPQAWGDPPSDVYLLAALNPSGQPHLMLPHVANEKKAMAAFGHSSSGWKPTWSTVVAAFGLQPGWKISTPQSGEDCSEDDEDDDSTD